MAIGYGTDTGARVSASLNRRWVNSEGHQLRGMTQVSQIESRIGANYIIPGQNHNRIITVLTPRSQTKIMRVRRTAL